MEVLRRGLLRYQRPEGDKRHPGPQRRQCPHSAVLSDFEKHIIQIWQEILEFEIPNEDLNKSFYELGADSLSIVRFVTQIEPLIKPEGVEKILLSPTLETLNKYKK